MPANLTPDYLAAEAMFREAQTNEEKLEALDEMMATIPKHKGTEKLRADIKRRMSKLRQKEREATKKNKRPDEFHVIKQGAGQIALVGPPNGGKSALLDHVTRAEPEVADYPFTTRKPLPGMMDFEDISIQLVDTPPIAPEHVERGIISLVRNADAVVVVLSASDDALLDQLEQARTEFGNSKTLLLGGEIGEEEYPVGVVAKPTLVAANKMDVPGASDNLGILQEFYGDEFRIIPISVETDEGLDVFKRAMFDSLGIVRVYTKMPGKPPDRDKPFTLKKGSTLLDFAATVHKDIASSLRFAKAWGNNILDGAQIGRDHVLQDGYVVELHA